MLTSIVQKSSWKWLFAEFIIVVLGVMTAMAADGLIQHMRQKSQVKTYKVRLLEDLQIIREQMQRKLQIHQLTDSYGKTVIAHLDGQAPDVPPNALLVALHGAANWESITLINSSWEDLQNSGSLTHFELSLRVKLIRFFNTQLTLPTLFQYDYEFRKRVRGGIPLSVQEMITEQCLIYDRILTDAPLDCAIGLDEDAAQTIYGRVVSQDGFVESLTYAMGQLRPVQVTMQIAIEQVDELIEEIEVSL